MKKFLEHAETGDTVVAAARISALTVSRIT
jgi:hypothetical protein